MSDPGSIPEGARCRDCGYSLCGLADSRCPECGTAVDPADPATFAVPEDSENTIDPVVAIVAVLVAVHLCLSIEIVWNVALVATGSGLRSSGEYDAFVAAGSIVTLVVCIFARKRYLILLGLLNVALGVLWVFGLFRALCQL